MAVYYTSLAPSNGTGKTIGSGWNQNIVTATAIVAMTTAMIDNANDDVGLFYLPAGAVVVRATVAATDMDTNGSPALAIDVGDSGDEDRLFAASTVGQTGTLSTAMARTGFLYKYTSRTEIRAYIQTAAATGAAGTLYVAVDYFVDPDFNTTALTAST
jgi:hypothetical protein